MGNATRGQRGTGQSHLAALLSYTLAALLLTWPLAARLATHLPGDGIDDPALAWNLWWIKHSLVDLRQADIFHAGWMFHPIGINLAFYTLTPLQGLLSIPLQTATTLILANNLILLSSFVLGGYGTFLLVRTVWAAPLARLAPAAAWWIAWLAGALYAFAGAKLFYTGLGQFNIAASQWLPFCALYLWRALHSGALHSGALHSGALRAALRNGAIAGLFLVCQAWAELTYASFLLILYAWAGLWLLFHTLRTRRLAALLPPLAGMAASGVVFALGIAPFLAAMLPDLAAEGDFFASGGGFADVFSADLLGYLLPTRLHPWFGDWVAALPFPNDKGQHIFLGYSVIALLLVGSIAGLRHAATRRATAFWLGALLLFWLLTLGPTLRWASHDLSIPGPFAAVSQLPFFSGNRYPSRYSVMLLLAAAVLLARGLLALLASRPPTHRRAALALVGLLLVGEHLSVPLPLNDFRTPDLYARLAQTPGDFTLLELPTGWRNGARVVGRADVLIMMQQWYQTTHAHRRLGGNTSRNPAYKFQYFSETPLIGDWIALMNADREHLAPYLAAHYPDLVARGRAQAADALALMGVRYVMLHADHAPALLTRYVEDALPVTQVDEWQGADWLGRAATLRLYQVNPSAPPTALDLSDPAAQLYLAEGWSPAGVPGVGRYATRPQVDLLLPAPATAGTLRLRYAAPITVAYNLDGRPLGEFQGTEHRIPWQATPDTAAPQRLTLRFAEPPRPLADLAPSASPIGSAGTALAPGVVLLARSAGEEVGDFAELWVNGVNVAANTRGYNLVALTTDGAVLAQAVFDTFSPGQSAALAAWLAQWPAGTVIAGAAADEVSLNLDDAAIAALARLGVQGDLRGQFRSSHAFIGVVGARTGSALEQVSLIHPATVWVGAPLPAPAGYGPLLRVEFAPAP